ncbi:MAG: carbonic anhydrase family protein [Betaproteobacteria bacterium]|nr:MAG: carbonic anhydrase family protein [Betaproteobacteria bacterium]
MPALETNPISAPASLTRGALTTALLLTAGLLQAAPSAAPTKVGDDGRTWQAISTEPGKRIEVDRASIKRDESGKVSAWGRIVLEKDLPDAQSASNYRSIEALGRYDCSNRTYATLKRVYVKASGELLREEEIKVATDMPVRANTLDDKLLRDICRPTTAADMRKLTQATVAKANVAAEELKKANEEMVKKAVQRESTQAPTPVKSLEHMEIQKPQAAPAYAPRPAPYTAAAPRAAKSRPAAKPEGLEGAEQHHAIHWSYEGEGGPDFWGRLKPDFATCDKGRRQSPIDIWDGIRVDLPPIEFSYRPTRFRLVDNGHTLQASFGHGSLTHLGKTYDLVQVHFHRPSEERVNGKAFDMVAHMVHRSDDNQLAVVAVLLEKGTQEHPVIQTLWNYIPLEKNQEVLPPDAAVDLNQLLPEKRGYYTYMGSLTTPPCSEGVLWLVMQQPVQVSAQQIAIFSRLYRNNARPVQPSNGRLIKESR